jgi:hypothetical protein
LNLGWAGGHARELPYFPRRRARLPALMPVTYRNSELRLADPSTRSIKLPRPARSTKIGLLIAVGFAVVSAIVVVVLKVEWTSSAPTNKVSDPSVVIGTFITLYGLFIGAFGVLVGFVANKGHGTDLMEVLRVAAIALLAGGALMDLLRVLDSTNDLFTAATSGLSYRALADTVRDFRIYFFVNMLVATFGIAVASLLPGSPD